MEAILEEHLNITVIGSPSARFLPKWSKWLAENTSVKLVVVCHLDESHNGQRGIGQSCASEAVKLYRKHGGKAHYFPWSNLLVDLMRLGMRTAIGDVHDVADTCTNRLLHEVSFKKIQEAFLRVI